MVNTLLFHNLKHFDIVLLILADYFRIFFANIQQYVISV